MTGGGKWLKNRKPKAETVAALQDTADSKLQTATLALREIASGYYLAKDAPKRLDECVDLARRTLTLIGEKRNG